MAGVSARGLIVATLAVAAVSIALTAITEARAVGQQHFAVSRLTIALLLLLWPQLRGHGR